MISETMLPEAADKGGAVTGASTLLAEVRLGVLHGRVAETADRVVHAVVERAADDQDHDGTLLSAP
jgi:hypothetical protein